MQSEDVLQYRHLYLMTELQQTSRGNIESVKTRQQASFCIIGKMIKAYSMWNTIKSTMN